MVKKLHKSIGHAWRGLRHILVRENSFRWMIGISILVVSAMLYFPTSVTEKLILLIMIFTILSLELVNTVFERIMDFIHREHNESIRDIKDLMAAIVLFVGLGASVVGSIIFWPYLF